MNSLKSLAMNCGPLSEMIRGLTPGYCPLARSRPDPANFSNGSIFASGLLTEADIPNFAYESRPCKNTDLFEGREIIFRPPGRSTGCRGEISAVFTVYRQERARNCGTIVFLHGLSQNRSFPRGATRSSPPAQAREMAAEGYLQKARYTGGRRSS
jgi:hypothetical protein